MVLTQKIQREELLTIVENRTREIHALCLLVRRLAEERTKLEMQRDMMLASLVENGISKWDSVLV